MLLAWDGPCQGQAAVQSDKSHDLSSLALLHFKIGSGSIILQPVSETACAESTPDVDTE
jgi:hypothetical protein